MNGDEDLAQDITMKGEKFHYLEEESNIQLSENNSKLVRATQRMRSRGADYPVDRLPYISEKGVGKTVHIVAMTAGDYQLDHRGDIPQIERDRLKNTNNMWDYPYKYQAPVDPAAAAAEGAPAEEGKAAAPAAAPPAAFAQVGRVIYPVRMSDRDYVNANMWDGKYPENFNADNEGNTASRVQALHQKSDDFDSTSVAGPAHTDQIGQSVYESAIIDPNANKRNPVGITGNNTMWTYNGQKDP